MTHARQSIPQDGLPAESAAAVVSLRAGEQPAHTARRLLQQGYSAPQTTQLLRHAYRTLHAEQVAQQRRIAPHVYHQVVALLRAGSADDVIIDAVVAHGVERDQAARLVAVARQHWQARVAAHASRLIRWLRVWCVVLGAATMLLGVWSGARPEPAHTSSPAPVTLNAVVLADELNVRSGPSRSYPVLFTLSAHQTVQVIGRAPATARYKIKVRDQREGWIRGDAESVWLQVAQNAVPTIVP